MLRYIICTMIGLLVLSSATAQSTVFYNAGNVVTLKPKGILFVGGDIEIDNMSSTPGEFFNDGDISLTGDWINNSTGFVFQVGDNGKLIFLGVGTQAIKGSKETHFNSMVLNKPGSNGKVRQYVDATCDQQLDLGNDLLNTDTFIFLVNNSDKNAIKRDGKENPVFKNLSNKGHVISKAGSAGRLGRVVKPGSTYFFPVGGDTIYRPLQIQSLNDSNTVFVQFVDAATPDTALKDTGISSLNPDWYMLVEKKDADTGKVILSMHFDKVVDDISNVSEAVLANWRDTMWVSENPYSKTGTNPPNLGYVSKTGWEIPDVSDTTGMNRFALSRTSDLPDIICPNNIVVSNDATLCAAVVNWQPPTGGSSVQTMGLSPGSQFPVGSSTIGYAVTDSLNNVVNCVFTIDVNDVESPSSLCQDSINVNLNAQGVAYLSPSMLDNGSYDNCGIDSASLDLQFVTCSAIGGQSVMLSNVDSAGNSSNCSTVVSAYDVTAPVAVCQNITVGVPISTGVKTISASLMDGGSTDNCSALSVTASQTTFTLADSNGVSVTVYVTDSEGNLDSCTAIVTTVISLNSAPIAACQNITIYTDNTCSAGFTAGDLDGGSTDADGDSLTFVSTLNGPLSPGSYTATLIVSDPSNEKDSCTATISVADSTSPVLVLQNLDVYLDANGNGSINPADADLNSSDNCGLGSFTASTSNFGCGDVGANNVSISNTDVHGNSSNSTIVVTVHDTIAPALQCQSITVATQPSGNVTITPGQIVTSSSDACGVSTSTVTPATFSCVNIGGNTAVVTVSDSNGNSSTCTVTVTVTGQALVGNITAPTKQCGYNISCSGLTDGSATANMTGGCLPYSYAWSNGDTSSTISGVGAGTYTLTVSDAAGSVHNDTIILTEPDPIQLAVSSPTFSCGHNVSCFGKKDGGIQMSVTGGGNCQAYSFVWSGPNGFSSTVQQPNGLEAGAYSVNVDDVNGCTASVAITLTEPAVLKTTLTPSTYAGGWNISCHGANDGAVTTATSGGCAPYSYLWNDGATSKDITGRPAGGYMVNITDANGCETNGNVTLTQPDSLNMTFMITDVSCNGGSDGSVAMNVTGGTQPYGYNWSGPGGFASSNQNISGLQTGNYTVTVMDTNGCSKTMTEFVPEPPVLTATGVSATYACGFNITCNATCDGMVDLTADGGNGGYTYAWSGPNGFSSPSEDLVNLCAGFYAVVVTDVKGCTANFSVELDEPDPLVIDSIVPVVRECGYNISCNGADDGELSVFVSGGAFCNPYEVTILTTGAASFSQTTSDGSPISFNNLPGSGYVVNVNDDNACMASGTIVLTEPDSLWVEAGPNETVFFGYPDSACTQLQATGAKGGCAPYLYVWTDGAGNVVANTSSITVCPDISTQYFVTITDQNGCQFTDSMRVCVIDVVCGNSPDKTKIVMCHVPPGNPAGQHEVCIGLNAATNHLYGPSSKHGNDYLGPCNPTGAPVACNGPSKTFESESGGAEAAAAPAGYTFEAFPNPFSEKTTLRFSFDRDEHVKLTIYTVTGVEIKTIFNGSVTESERYEVVFDRNGIADGLYFARLVSSSGRVMTRKLELIR